MTRHMNQTRVTAITGKTRVLRVSQTMMNPPLGWITWHSYTYTTHWHSYINNKQDNHWNVSPDTMFITLSCTASIALNTMCFEVNEMLRQFRCTVTQQHMQSGQSIWCPVITSTTDRQRDPPAGWLEFKYCARKTLMAYQWYRQQCRFRYDF